jgi:GH15 family glucan-1,4-alpha-glucosidase
MHDVISMRTWNTQRGAFFVSTFDGDARDATLLLLHEVDFLAADDPRFAATVSAVENAARRFHFPLRRPARLRRPRKSFQVCIFWYVNALATLGRRGEARALFEKLLACRNRHGLPAEHVDPNSGEQWGNFVQTYSMVGLINAAIRLSIRWDQAF